MKLSVRNRNIFLFPLVSCAETNRSSKCKNHFKMFFFITVPGTSVGLEQTITTDTSFKSLEGKICEHTLKGIVDMEFTHMTEIQAKAIPHLLEGR